MVPQMLLQFYEGGRGHVFQGPEGDLDHGKRFHQAL